MILKIVILNIYLNICYGFNADTASIERFTGISESMFGYSSALHTNNEGSWFVFLLYFIFKNFLFKIQVYQGRIQDFKLGGGALKKIAPSGGRRENIWDISSEKSRFYAKKNLIFPILGGAREIFGVFHVKNHDFTPKKCCNKHTIMYSCNTS